jgi:hypothetical protein
MKNCPTCKRTYEDDSFAFCLDDGARLSAAYDPHSTLPGPAARDTDPPRTERLPPELTPANPTQPPLHSTILALPQLAYPQEAPRSQPTGKRRGNFWIIFSGMLALVVVALIIVLGYLAWKAGNLAWKAGNKPIPEPLRVSAAAPTNSKVPANANQDIQSKLADSDNFRWLEGVWEGEGYQSDTRTTWAVRLRVQDGTYAIEYPNIPCRGRWTLIDKNSVGASFTEVITQGIDRCGNNSHVMIEKVNVSEISCKFTHARSRVVIATAVLSKKAQSTGQR